MDWRHLLQEVQQGITGLFDSRGGNVDGGLLAYVDRCESSSIIIIAHRFHLRRSVGQRIHLGFLRFSSL